MAFPKVQSNAGQKRKPLLANFEIFERTVSVLRVLINFVSDTFCKYMEAFLISEFLKKFLISSSGLEILCKICSADSSSEYLNKVLFLPNLTTWFPGL